MNAKDFKDIENPWANISWENTIAEGDAAAINEFNSKIEDERLTVDTELLPEPFTGDLKTAKIVCLNLNPGISDADERFKGNPRLLELTQKTLRNQLGYSMWFDEIKDDNENPHPGCKWWKSHTKMLREKLAGGNGKEDLDGKELKLFVLEFFPYHTTSASEFPSLASDEYRNYLLNKAMEAGKLIVIMRSRERWFEIKTIVKDSDGNPIELGKKLQQYENKLYILNAQNACLSENNLIDPKDFAKNWELLTDTLRA